MPLDNIDNATTGNTPTPVTPQDQQAAANTSPAQDTSAQNQPGNTAPQFQSPTSTAPGVPAQPQQTKSKDPNQQMISGAAAAQPDPVQSHPLVQKAGILNAVATALSGGPRYTETINDQGVRVRTPAPLTGRQIGMAIAMEAIQGSLAGLQAGRGRGMGAAGLAGFQQVQKQTQQRDDQQDQKAQQDFVNKASAYAANLRTRSMAQEVGMRDEAAHKDWVAQHASTVNYIRENNPASIIKDDASEAEVTTPEFTKQALKNGWTAIPVGYEPRFDAQGNHFTKDGVAMHNNTFMIVDSRKLALQPDVIAKAQSWGLPGFTNRNGEPLKLADNLDVRVGTIIDTSNKVAALDQEQRDLNGYYGYLADKGVKGPDGKPLAAPDLKSMVKQNPTLISNITGPWANHFAESPSAALKAMKDNVPAKGPISALYGGQNLLDRYDLEKSLEKKGAEKSLDADAEINKEKRLIPIKAATAGAEARAREQASQPDNLSENEIVNGMLDGSVDITKTASIRSNQRERYIALAKQKDPSFDMSTYGLRLKMNQSYTSGKQGDQIQSFNTFMQHAADASDVTNEYRQTRSPLINKSLNWMAKNATGDPGYSKFVAAIEPVRKEFATFLEGGHALTESDKHAANTILSDDSSPAQIQAALKQMAHTGSIRLGSLDDRYRSTFGHSYQGLLYPDTVTAAQKLGLGDFAAKYSGGQAQTRSLGNVQTPQIPKGATMKVPGSDGKLHWSDGKSDLGVVQ
jgi:hypothetical protein